MILRDVLHPRPREVLDALTLAERRLLLVASAAAEVVSVEPDSVVDAVAIALACAALRSIPAEAARVREVGRVFDLHAFVALAFRYAAHFDSIRDPIPGRAYFAA